MTKPKVVPEKHESENLSGMLFQRSKKSTPKRVKQAAQGAKQGRQEEKRVEGEEGEGDAASSTPHTRTAGMAFET